jgi:hypothetical protein
LSCLRSHFLTASVTLLSSSKWVPHKASLRDSKVVEVLWCQIWAVGWIRQHRPTHFGDVFPGSQTCVKACIVMLEQHFSVIEHTLPVLFKSCRANCRVVMRQSAWIMASARFYMSGVLAVSGRPPRGRSRSLVSALPDTLTPLAHCPAVLLSLHNSHTLHTNVYGCSPHFRFREPRI